MYYTVIFGRRICFIRKIEKIRRNEDQCIQKQGTSKKRSIMPV